MVQAEGKAVGRKYEQMIPIGRLIQEKLAEKGQTVSWLAREIPCTRANLYKIFKKDNLDTEILYRISTVLDFDFFSYYSDGLKE